jgi:hypothetical protein
MIARGGISLLSPARRASLPDMDPSPPIQTLTVTGDILPPEGNTTAAALLPTPAGQRPRSSPRSSPRPRPSRLLSAECIGPPTADPN